MTFLSDVLKNCARQALDFALPPRCVGCGAITTEANLFCFTCWQDLRLLGEPCCARCALPFEYSQGADAECAACLADPPAFDSLRAAVAYGPVARSTMMKLKYGGKPWVASTVAAYLQRHLVLSDQILLAPVPLHRGRIWARGYNQSALIASRLAKLTGAEADLDLLRRNRATPPLRDMSRRKRAESVRGAFSLPKGKSSKLRGRTVVLVDDVYTTGSTVNECAKVLKKGGATAVNIICWARVFRTDD